MRFLCALLMLGLTSPAAAGGVPSTGLPSLDFPPRPSVETTRPCTGPVAPNGTCLPQAAFSLDAKR